MNKQKISEDVKFPKKREYYDLSLKLIRIIDKVVSYECSGSVWSRTEWKSVKYGDMTMRVLLRWPGRSVELLVGNKKVFEAGNLLLSGIVAYSKFKKGAITLDTLNRLFELADLVETAENKEVNEGISSEAKRKLSRLIKRV